MRDLFIALALLVLAAVLLMKQRENLEKEADKESERKSRARVSGGPGIQTIQESDRDRVKSDRVLRDGPALITTESGLKYEVLVEGAGEKPSLTSTVEVHYVGTLEDGTVFDSSRERGAPSKFPLNAVIKGWTEGMQLMKTGGLYRFTIPPELAYGSRAVGDKIPSNATLIFEVELFGFEGG